MTMDQRSEAGDRRREGWIRRSDVVVLLRILLAIEFCVLLATAIGSVTGLALAEVLTSALDNP